MKPVQSPYLVPTDGSFRLADVPTEAPSGDEAKWEKKLKKRVKQFAQLQKQLYADDRYALLLVFQAMDAAGKDGTIRAVTSGVNPAGFQVYSFKKPSAEELDHDFLWRTSRSLPERGRVGIFNRSYYEEVLVVRVHPEYLGSQKLAHASSSGDVPLEQLWDERYKSIREHERHLACNGTVVLKFFLNISQKEQHERFVARIDDAEKHWKFSAGDVAESRHWDKYMNAYEQALAHTSRDWAPWYAIPADDKRYMRMAVADIIQKTLESLPLRWPEMGKADHAQMLALRTELVGE